MFTSVEFGSVVAAEDGKQQNFENGLQMARRSFAILEAGH
jgi:hypothetical protein